MEQEQTASPTSIELTKNEFANLELRTHLITQKQQESLLLTRERQLYFNELLFKYKLDGSWAVEDGKLVKKIAIDKAE